MNSDFRLEFALKNFVWFLVFAAICVFCVSKILLPQINEYKKQALESKKSKIAFNQINKDYQAIEAQLKTLSIQHYKMLLSLHNQGDEAKLQALLQDYFTEVEVKKLNTTREQDILDTRYQVIGYAPTTQSIEDFILWANTMPYFARVELPLKMELDEKSKQIYFVIVISLKNSDYKEHQIILENHLRFDYFKP
ncbi:hypothetical protein LS66_000285 [Helicobacter sp. MIT 03-1614]|jgi:hypothetical protein|uniref:Uncharacterized protein n=1 Tax=Helicobacter hepaticus (strain ATCC 51449 / 3B1) TaxID=235279 RepID=Q7VGP2_HELHP|nr:MULTISPECIES: hypothetical protein [Helicobacter]AAP77875.1 hypothetical protein HH_1278 [Helicobacter hepaticus ATCC 51449]TLD90808.1 hypothetical protein LS66_000285 [Helicobacter sp. MIT 03-1614]